MISFFIALVTTAAAALGARETIRVARLSATLGARTALLTACWLACATASGLAAWLGSQIAVWVTPKIAALLAALALLVAASELALLGSGRAPAEPTRSFGAIAIVLGVAHLISAAGLLVLALAATFADPELVAIGGTLGVSAALTAAWRAGWEWETRMPLVILRWSVAGFMLLAAIAIGMSARAPLG